MENKERLAKEPVGRLLLSLSLPAVMSQLINALYNIVDRIFIGHIPGNGAAALTGVGVCFPILMLISAFANLVGMGSAPRAAIYMGKKKNDTAEKILGNAFSALVGVSVILTLSFLLFREPMLHLFGASRITMEYAKSYSTIYVMGTIFVQLTMGLSLFISTQGFTKESMKIVVTGAVINIGLDPLFIFAFKQGVRGAAMATVISQGVTAVLVIRFFRGNKTMLRLKKENFRVQWTILGPCLALGIAPFVMISTESILQLCFNKSLLRYGGDLAVGAMTILASIMQFGLLPLNGITQGGQPIISYNYGAGNIQRVREAFRKQTLLCFAYASLIWAVVMFIPGIPVGFFTSEAKLYGLSKRYIRIYGAGMLCLGLQVSCQQAFIAFGNAKTSTFLAFFRKLIMLIPLIYILPHIMENKVKAVFLAEPISDIVAAAVTCTMFFFQFKKIRECKVKGV